MRIARKIIFSLIATLCLCGLAVPAFSAPPTAPAALAPAREVTVPPYSFVCDARGVFTTAKRFPDADEVIVKWPHKYLEEITVDPRTAICVLTHDPKFDVPLLRVALATEAGYIGAMGSRRTHDDRMAKLREVGVPEDQLARLRSPIGLDLRARTPEETAVSIAAELIQLRWGGSGQALTETAGTIHGGVVEESPVEEPVA